MISLNAGTIPMPGIRADQMEVGKIYVLAEDASKNPKVLYYRQEPVPSERNFVRVGSKTIETRSLGPLSSSRFVEAPDASIHIHIGKKYEHRGEHVVALVIVERILEELRVRQEFKRVFTTPDHEAYPGALDDFKRCLKNIVARVLQEENV